MDLQDTVSHLAPLQYTSLTNGDIMRYSRQLLLPELGVKGESLMKQWFETISALHLTNQAQTSRLLSLQVK